MCLKRNKIIIIKKTQWMNKNKITSKGRTNKTIYASKGKVND